jgi:hypothetical protein
MADAARTAATPSLWFPEPSSSHRAQDRAVAWGSIGFVFRMAAAGWFATKPRVIARM